MDMAGGSSDKLLSLLDDRPGVGPWDLGRAAKLARLSVALTADKPKNRMTIRDALPQLMELADLGIVGSGSGSGSGVQLPQDGARTVRLNSGTSFYSPETGLVCVCCVPA
jgi:hypothetical protein